MVKFRFKFGKKKPLLFNPFKKIVSLIFKCKFKKPLFIKSLPSSRHRHRSRGKNTSSTHKSFNNYYCFGGVPRSQRKSRDHHMDRLMEVKSFNNSDTTGVITGTGAGPGCFPSPLTPAAAASCGRTAASKEEELDVKDACRSFENYLMEMIMEEGKLKDLMDVEELLYCWNNLKSPLFINLVCRFYGELCKDLFSNN